MSNMVNSIHLDGMHCAETIIYTTRGTLSQLIGRKKAMLGGDFITLNIYISKQTGLKLINSISN